MNSEQYWDKCQELDRYSIELKDIRKRWFRNHYVLYQSSGFFTHNYFVCKYNEVDRKYTGHWYGPFWDEIEADKFGRKLCDLHFKYISS